MEVVEDYRQRVIVDPDSPILAFKASRDRYTNLPSQAKYAGLPYLGSWNSEDALTWNVFRTLQETGRLSIISDRLGIGQPKAILLWTMAPEIDKDSAELQFVTGTIIRKFDGILRGQMTEPDVVIKGIRGITVIECKLGEPKACTHLWEGTLESVTKRLPVYTEELPQLVNREVSPKEVVPVYQMVRMAFYARKLGDYFRIEPVVVSLANKKNWDRIIRSRRLRKSPSELWDIFCNRILGSDHPRCENLSWQDIDILVRGISLNSLEKYLSGHPCL